MHCTLQNANCGRLRNQFLQFNTREIDSGISNERNVATTAADKTVHLVTKILKRKHCEQNIKKHLGHHERSQCNMPKVRLLCFDLYCMWADLPCGVALVPLFFNRGLTCEHSCSFLFVVCVAFRLGWTSTNTHIAQLKPGGQEGSDPETH